MRKLVVIALGGNAITRRDTEGSWEAQWKTVLKIAKSIASLYQEGFRVVVTHGNGPQVGVQMLRHEAIASKMPSSTLDVIVAETQGSLGYLLQQAIDTALQELGAESKAVTILTRVLVDPDDPRVKRYDKPVGCFYDGSELQRLQTQHPDWVLQEELGKGFRRRVPSPRPVAILEIGAIRALVDAGYIPISAGGGGIPIKGFGANGGIEAVIDKDLTTSILAIELRADLLILATDVDSVYLNYGLPEQKRLDRVHVNQLERYLTEGHFPPGSMGPKVEAAVAFARKGGIAAIGAVDEILHLARGTAGTIVEP